jgi:hypothetical protein
MFFKTGCDFFSVLIQCAFRFMKVDFFKFFNAALLIISEPCSQRNDMNKEYTLFSEEKQERNL